MAFDDEYISKKEAILAVTRDGCTANVVGVLYHLPPADVAPKSEIARKIFEEIYEDCFDQFGYIDYEKLDELKKKYEENNQ